VGRTGSSRVPFYASTVDGRAKRAWTARNAAERKAVEAEGRELELLTLMTMHECRHTFASLLIDTGANPKAIQEVIGHSKIQTTSTFTGICSPAATTTYGRAWTPTLPPTSGCPLAETWLTGAFTGAQACFRTPARPSNRRFLAPQQKTPRWEAGRFWGYYREERYVSLYMWIRGR
jgi:hypothetical protein